LTIHSRAARQSTCQNDTVGKGCRQWLDCGAGLAFTGHYTPVGNPSIIVFIDLDISVRESQWGEVKCQLLIPLKKLLTVF